MVSITNAAQAADFLLSLVLPTPRSYSERAETALQAIAELLDSVDNPQQHLTVVHIAGSKGKGSTALLLEAILQAAGLRTGTFTSPHLQRWTERYRVNGQEISEHRFATLIEQLQPAVAAQRHLLPNNPVTFFEVLTAGALLLFAQEQVDVAIVEVGLGGRLDATNIVAPTVTCVTSIEFEHTDKLGTKLAAIAGEKAGIIKPKVPVICGRLPATALGVIAATANTQEAPLLRLGKDFTLAQVGGVYQYAESTGEISFQSPLTAQHILENMALAIACAKQLPAPKDLAAAVREGLADMTLPGRCEVISRTPWVLIDGAHTLESARALRREIERLGSPKTHWILSFTQGKNAAEIVQQWVRPGDQITITQAEPDRSRPAVEVATVLAKHFPATPTTLCPDPQQAISQALAETDEQTLICIAGSIYLAGLGRRLLV